MCLSIFDPKENIFFHDFDFHFRENPSFRDEFQALFITHLSITGSCSEFLKVQKILSPFSNTHHEAAHTMSQKWHTVSET